MFTQKYSIALDNRVFFYQKFVSFILFNNSKINYKKYFLTIISLIAEI